MSTNLTGPELRGLKSLKARKGEVHISVSDKGGDFVICPQELYLTMTNQHIQDNHNAYEFIQPTRHAQGKRLPVPIKSPTEVSFSAQIQKCAIDVENECNAVWNFICKVRGFTKAHANMFKVKHSTLPVMYTLIKTHKLTHKLGSHIPLPDIKVRPIVSCSGSPTEPLATLAARIVAPSFLPSPLTSQVSMTTLNSSRVSLRMI